MADFENGCGGEKKTYKELGILTRTPQIAPQEIFFTNYQQRAPVLYSGQSIVGVGGRGQASGKTVHRFI